MMIMEAGRRRDRVGSDREGAEGVGAGGLRVTERHKVTRCWHTRTSYRGSDHEFIWSNSE